MRGWRCARSAVDLDSGARYGDAYRSSALGANPRLLVNMPFDPPGCLRIQRAVQCSGWT